MSRVSGGLLSRHYDLIFVGGKLSEFEAIGVEGSMSFGEEDGSGRVYKIIANALRPCSGKWGANTHLSGSRGRSASSADAGHRAFT